MPQPLSQTAITDATPSRVHSLVALALCFWKS
jgi:hypothetical protein